jgi:DNA-binding XRE family transcriptional regulator
MNRLKLAYEWAGLSQRQFARMLGVSHTTVQNWEVEGMPDGWVADVCDVCDVSRRWLRTGESEATQGDIDEIERVLSKLPADARERLRPQLMAASKRAVTHALQKT